MHTPLHPRGYPLTELGLPPALLRRLMVDDVVTDTFDLRVLHPDALKQFWGLTTDHFVRINKALEEKGLHPMSLPTGAVVRAPNASKLCPEPGLVEGQTCGMTKMKGKRKCAWHVLAGMPIEKQIHYADKRGEANRARDGHVERMRVPADEWPAGTRWCSECQSFIPLVYVTGTKCKAHASRASHASRIKAVYDLTQEDYEALLKFQGGRCYICRQLPQKKRLAIDHDHRTNAVRGLLCANDEWGCNVSLRRLLNSIDMAQRALEYVTMSPYDRMRSEMVPDELTPPSDAWNPFA